jgi:hypothetical protein
LKNYIFLISFCPHKSESQESALGLRLAVSKHQWSRARGCLFDFSTEVGSLAALCNILTRIVVPAKLVCDLGDPFLIVFRVFCAAARVEAGTAFKVQTPAATHAVLSGPTYLGRMQYTTRMRTHASVGKGGSGLSTRPGTCNPHRESPLSSIPWKLSSWRVCACPEPRLAGNSSGTASWAASPVCWWSHQSRPSCLGRAFCRCENHRRIWCRF